MHLILLYIDNYGLLIRNDTQVVPYILNTEKLLLCECRNVFLKYTYATLNYNGEIVYLWQNVKFTLCVSEIHTCMDEI